MKHISAEGHLYNATQFEWVGSASETVRDLLEILDDRYDHGSTLITTQLPVDQWHAYLGDRTVADAILDHLVHNSYLIVLKGESMRKRLSPISPSKRGQNGR